MDPSEMGDSIRGVTESSMELITTWGLSVVGAIAVLLIGRWLAGSVRKGVRRGLEKRAVDASLIPFLSSAAYYLVLIMVGVAVLNLFGVETTSVIAVLGAASLAVGLALQGTLSNFAAGTMLLVFRPFRVGDFVEVAGSAGSVAEIGLFSTSLDTPDNVRIIMPNSAIYGDTIKNYAANDRRRVDLVMGVSYGDDLGVASQTIERIVRADGRVLSDPEPVVAVHQLADSSVNFVVRPWCRREDYWGVYFDLTRALKEGLEAAGCSIPFPQRDVHVMRGEAA